MNDKKLILKNRRIFIRRVAFSYNLLINNNHEIEKPKFINDYNDTDFENKEVKNFKETKIYFLRIVRRKGEKAGENEYGFIDILKQEIKLPKDLINLFVFCVLDLKSKKIDYKHRERRRKTK